MKENRELMLEAVKRNGYNILIASEVLKKDKDIVTAAVTSYGRAIQSIDESLKTKEIVLLAIENGKKNIIKYASRHSESSSDSDQCDDEDQSDVDQSDVGLLRFAPPELLNDTEFLQEIVEEYPYAIHMRLLKDIFEKKKGELKNLLDLDELNESQKRKMRSIEFCLRSNK